MAENIVYAVKVDSGVARIHDARTGQFKRLVGSNVVSAQNIGSDLIQTTEKNGSVKIYNAKTGQFMMAI